MKKDKKIILALVGILLVIMVGIALSYAYWLTSHTQETSNVLSSPCFSISYADQDNISLTKQFPISDTDGLALTPYKFTITNTCTINATYQINLETLNTSTFDISHLKMSFNATDETASPTLLNSITSTSPTLTNASDARALETGTLKSGDTKTYELRLWMDSSTSQTDGENKTYSSKIVVTAVAKNFAYKDNTGASSPELYQGLIPVTYDASGNVVVADTTEEWYNYATHNWANAVLVDCSDTTIKDKYFDSDMKLLSSAEGSTIPMSEILQMYVWIPRYKYLLWNAENGTSNPQAITIVFEDKETTKSTGSTNGTYLTHPAFTFGSTELNGIWVGKFETSGTTSKLKVLPNVNPLTSGSTISTVFNATRNTELTYSSTYGLDSSIIDTHLIKNSDWGAIAYLSSSIYGRYNDSSTCIDSGCEVWINNVNVGTATRGYGPTVTGCAGTSVTATAVTSSTCVTNYDWTTNGVNASTTGNQYGIYDMSGGGYDTVMGNMSDSSGNFYPSNSGLTNPDAKYYDSYSYSASSVIDYARGHLGDATRETLTTLTNNNSGGWYLDSASLPSGAYTWFLRGGAYYYGTSGGIFYFSRNQGYGSHDDAYVAAFRSVLTAQ